MSAHSRSDADRAAPGQLSLFPPDEFPELEDGAGAEVGDRRTGPGTERQPVGDTADASSMTRDAAPEGSAALAKGEPPANTPPSASRRRPATLKAAMVEYQQFLTAANRAKHTRASFGLDLRLFLEHVGDLKLEQIGEVDLRSFISWVRIERRNSPISVRRKVASLKNFFSYLYRERLIEHDPAIRLIYPEAYPALPEFLEDGAAADLLAAAAEHPFWHALLVLMLETGLKRDEVVALGWSDLSLHDADREESYLVVRETEQAKRLRSRRLELSPPVARLLRAYRDSEPRREHFFDVSPRGVNFIVETCGHRARIVTRGKKLTPQILRATFAVRRMRAMVRDEEALRKSAGEE
ncbi:MAG: tyrosine-type recombinase/integrase, partial [Chloroflexota bacterium]